MNDPYQREGLTLNNVSTNVLAPFIYPSNYPEALMLMENAVKGEQEDELLYTYLMSVAPNPESQEIISKIRMDELKHNRIFRTIYSQLTNTELPKATINGYSNPISYSDGIRKALQGEYEAVTRYRKILYAMQNRIHINAIVEVITDEIRHGGLYNYLLTTTCPINR